MFYRFSATPAKARNRTRGSGSARASNPSNNKGRETDASSRPEHTVLPLVRRQKIARACDRCRRHRIKCDEQKPCAQCVGIKAKCTVSNAPSRSSQPNNCDTGQTWCESSSSARPQSNDGLKGSNGARTSPISPSIPSSRMSMSQESPWATRTPPDNALKETLDLASHIQDFFTSGQPVLSHPSALAACLFPQLPYPAIPSGERPLASNALLRSQRRYYLRLFWDACHPLLQIMSETEFVELDALPPPTMFNEYSARNALVDSMIALGIQHSRATGLAGRILGLQQQPPRQYYHAAPSPETAWPGFEYFHRCRECMRTNTEMTLEVLRCHALMALYLMKGNDFRDAYNLLGITVRKAYIAKLHRLPPSYLPEAEKTARMQLWWVLFSLDLQCSLQLDMPAACQKSFVKCPFPAEDALARYVSSPSYSEGSMNAYTYSIRLVNLAVIVTDIAACVSTADLVDGDGNSPAALEHHALNLSSVLQNLEVWRDQLPSELLLSWCGNGSGDTEMLDFDRNLTLPAWLQRQTVLLELQYHNAYTLIQRAFIRPRSSCSRDAGGMVTSPDSWQPHVELHIASALHHAIKIVDTIFTVCSMSDVLYGWSEVLPPLWNATLTITAYVYANSLNSVVPRALDSLARAQAIFESFSPTCPTALSAKGIIQSLADSLQSMMAQVSCTVVNHDPMGWDLFASLLKEQETSPAGLENAASSNDLCGSVLFSPIIPSASHISTPKDNSATMQFGDL
ncbi:CheY-like superfamily [Pleurostoma richardsiae]|uniref:CheY-like superfamily n=1 Tax=Pleurostoma richardsiae TaxID=41990 RepID=A0AA38VSZ4_9PEZI|nr:CheY-like superfamily [Pleurostoma richardsiae]